MEYLPDTSFLGKLLVIPANVRLEWKVIARYKHSSLFGLLSTIKKKSYIRLHQFITSFVVNKVGHYCIGDIIRWVCRFGLIVLKMFKMALVLLHVIMFHVILLNVILF